MITKEELQEHFPDFRVHFCRFTEYDFYLLVWKGYSFHIDVYPGNVKVKCFQYSNEYIGLFGNDVNQVITDIKNLFV